eukprot:2345019-Karenia_brevis.AAC.1
MASKALAALARGLPVMIVGDSDVIINQVLGVFSVSDNLRQWCHECMAILTNLFEAGVRAPMGRTIMQQVPRSDNSTADGLANQALDRGVCHST